MKINWYLVIAVIAIAGAAWYFLYKKPAARNSIAYMDRNTAVTDEGQQEPANA